MSIVICVYLTKESITDHLIAITREIGENEVGIGCADVEIDGFYDLEISEEVLAMLETKKCIPQNTSTTLFKKALSELIQDNADLVRFFYVKRSEPNWQAAVEWSTGEFEELTIEETQKLVEANSNLYLHIHSADD
jgi:hypothetical protein